MQTSATVSSRYCINFENAEKPAHDLFNVEDYSGGFIQIKCHCKYFGVPENKTSRLSRFPPTHLQLRSEFVQTSSTLSRKAAMQ